MKGTRWVSALITLSLLATIIVLGIPSARLAEAQELPPGNATSTQFATDCMGYALGIGQAESNQMGFDTIAPSQVSPDEVFTVRIAPRQSAFPAMNDSPLGPVPVNGLLNINFMYSLPANASVEGVEIVPGTGFGTSGSSGVSISSSPPSFATRSVSTYEPPRIVLFVAEVPKNATPPTNETFFQLPAIDVTLRATGPVGSNISARVPGTDEPTSGYVFQAQSIAVASVYCWPQGNVQSPPLFQTAIGSGGQSLPTTTELTVDPTALPAGYDASMSATVTAPSGVVRFNDATTVLGYAELNEDGVATLETSLNTVGAARPITATFLGSPGFEPSTSAVVAVNVTNPAARTPAVVSVISDPARVALGVTATEGPADVTISVSPVGGPGTPTGTVRLYDNSALVGTQQLSGGSASFSITVPWGGHHLRADYVGDIGFFPASGAAPLVAGYGTATASPTAQRPMAGSVALNGASLASVPSAWTLNSPFRTNPDGTQDIGGIFETTSQTFAVSGGTVTGVLSQVGGVSEGEIAAGANASANLDSSFVFQVTSADLGSGAQDLGSTCWFGPFDVHFTGTRAGTNGALSLSASEFLISATQGNCLSDTGTSLTTALNARLTGGTTNVAFTLTPPPAAPLINVSPVVATPVGGAFFEQPVTLSATISRADGQNFAATANIGQIEFYAGDQLLGAVNTTGGAGPTKMATYSAPTDSTIVSGGNPPLPQGGNELRARFVPAASQKLNFATSSLSSPLHYPVWEALPKQPVAVELGVPPTAPAGEPVTLNVTITPAPDVASISSPTPLAGVVKIFDRSEPDPGLQQVRTVPFDLNVSGIPVSSSSDGLLSTTIALTPGVHDLEAVFVPVAASRWWWAPGTSELMRHEVTGEARPTSVEVVAESTRGSRKVPQGSNLYVTARLQPLAILQPFGGSISYSIDGGPPLDVTADVGGIGTVAAPGSELGLHEVQLWYNPLASMAFFPAIIGNLGFAPSEVVTFEYEVVAPSSGSPMATGTEIQSIIPTGTVSSGPAVQGQNWAQINGFVSFNAPGNVQYRAESLDTGVITNLGTPVNVVTTTTAATGRGLARLANNAATGSLPAGTYEVWGEYTPTGGSAANYQPSTSPRVTQVVVPSGSPLATEVSLSVEPGSPSQPDQPLNLTASIEPVSGATGTVEFFDDGESLGTAPVIGGVAPGSSGITSKIDWQPELGEHSYTATFTPANPEAVGASSSDPLEHLVVEPSEPTTTSLSVSPEGTAYEGDEVTLTATVDVFEPGEEPGEPVGSVLFTDGDTELGTALVEDGVATLVTDELALGEHIFSAQFVPSGTDFGPSFSDVVTYEITEAPVGPIETGTTLEISPETSASVGAPVTFTATITPSSAIGTVSFLDGANTIAGPVPVNDGQADVVIDSLALGTHSLVAAFDPSDPEAYEGSASPAQEYEINTDFVAPVFECQGVDPVSIGLMQSIVAPPDGILQLATQIEATVPETLTSGGSSNVAFTWTAILPENLAELAIAAEAEEIFMEDMTIAMEATGGSTQTWAFPATHTITDPAAPIVLQSSGTVTAGSVEDILYAVRSPLLITIHVPPTPLVFVDVYVNLTCEVLNATQAITTVEGGDITVPGAPTDVTATGGPLQANVSWTPPADDGGSAITGYVVTASPGGKTTFTSANVTNIDVIGLTAGQDYTFTVQAINEVGPGTASIASDPVSISQGEDFSDVQPGHAFFSEIEWLAATGITEGFGDGTFRPESTLARQGMAAFLYRLSGNPDGLDPQCTDGQPFSDVPVTNPFCGEIQWMKNEGITTGGPGNTFNPGGSLNRQAMSAFLYRLANGPEVPEPCSTAPFLDVPTSNVFCPEITWMAEMDITQTPPGGEFRPNDALKRQAMASFLYRYSLVVPTGL